MHENAMLRSYLEMTMDVAPNYRVHRKIMPHQDRLFWEKENKRLVGFQL